MPKDSKTSRSENPKRGQKIFLNMRTRHSSKSTSYNIGKLPGSRPDTVLPFIKNTEGGKERHIDNCGGRGILGATLRINRRLQNMS